MSEVHHARWEKRRAKGGPHNEPQLRADGTVRPDTIRVDHETGCWIWQYSFKSDDGTCPQGTAEGLPPSKPVQVRRWMYEKHIGPAPKKVFANCGNPRCVNPAHLGTDGLQYRTRQMRPVIQETQRAHPSWTFAEIAMHVGTTRRAVSQALSADVKRRPGDIYRAWVGRDIPPKPRSISDRNWEIFTRVAAGELATSCAGEFGLSYQRILQICRAVERRLAVRRAND